MLNRSFSVITSSSVSLLASSLGAAVMCSPVGDIVDYIFMKIVIKHVVTRTISQQHVCDVRQSSKSGINRTGDCVTCN